MILLSNPGILMIHIDIFFSFRIHRHYLIKKLWERETYSLTNCARFSIFSWEALMSKKSSAAAASITFFYIVVCEGVNLWESVQNSKPLQWAQLGCCLVYWVNTEKFLVSSSFYVLVSLDSLPLRGLISACMSAQFVGIIL